MEKFVLYDKEGFLVKESLVSPEDSTLAPVVIDNHNESMVYNDAEVHQLFMAHIRDGEEIPEILRKVDCANTHVMRHREMAYRKRTDGLVVELSALNLVTGDDEEIAAEKEALSNRISNIKAEIKEYYPKVTTVAANEFSKIYQHGRLSDLY